MFLGNSGNEHAKKLRLHSRLRESPPDTQGGIVDAVKKTAPVRSSTNVPRSTTPTEKSVSEQANAGAADTSEQPAASETELQRVELVRSDLLQVHRALLEAERVRYERVRGRVANNSAFLQLVINDPWFDWLRPMAQLVLLIDERTSDKKNILGSAEARALLERGRALLRADAEGDAFQRLYYQALQTSPALAVLTRQVAARHAH